MINKYLLNRESNPICFDLGEISLLGSLLALLCSKGCSHDCFEVGSVDLIFHMCHMVGKERIPFKLHASSTMLKFSDFLS